MIQRGSSTTRDESHRRHPLRPPPPHPGHPDDFHHDHPGAVPSTVHNRPRGRTPAPAGHRRHRRLVGRHAGESVFFTAGVFGAGTEVVVGFELPF